MKNSILIAVYFDLENVTEKLDLSRLIDSISLKIEEDLPSVFAIKLACGNEESISKFRSQLRDLNFDIREAPQVSKDNLKNRADLILTVEAFESLYIRTPEIDLYVFITSDTDFTVIMDKLRKYGKQVWLVTKENGKDKKLFTSSTDQILVIEDFLKEALKQKKNIAGIQKELIALGFSKPQSLKIKEIIESFEKDKWYPASIFGTKVRNTLKDFSYKGKNVNSQNKLFGHLKSKGYIDTRKDGPVDYFTIIK